MEESGGAEHIHVMSAGQGLKSTFPLALRHYRMDRVLIVTDVPMNETADEKKNKVVMAVREITTTTEKVGLPTEILEVSSALPRDVLAKFVEFYARFPKASYYFNVTGGRKPLALSLMLASIWVGGECYYVPEVQGDEIVGIQELNVPRMHLDEVRKNPNYESFLILLDRRGPMELKSAYCALQEGYIPQRRKDGSRQLNFSRPTMSKWLRQLEAWGLIVLTSSSSLREKNVALTEEGTFTARFLKASRK